MFLPCDCVLFYFIFVCILKYIKTSTFDLDRQFSLGVLKIWYISHIVPYNKTHTGP